MSQLPSVKGTNERVREPGSEESLRVSEVRFRRLFETAQDGILILDSNTGAITDVNPFLIKLLGFTREEIIGKAIWEIGLATDVEASKDMFQELTKKGYVRYENLPLERKGGVSIPVEIVSNVYREESGTVIQCNVRDISARRRAEQSAQRLLQAQKMESVGQLAGGLAHDFNNLLGVILGYCEILEAREDLPSKVLSIIAGIAAAGKSGKNLTQRLLAFGRLQVLDPVVMDLNEAVTGAGSMLGRLIGDEIELVCVLSGSLGMIKADSSQIEQVLMNLTINARDAMPKGGKIEIKTENVVISEAGALEHPFLKAGRYVALTVSDSGTGMTSETQSHIFEPFFSTKDVGRGTGLGLSTVFGIVRQCEGMIAVYSELGHGASFTIHFPRVDEARIVVQPQQQEPCKRGTETILLVDDSPTLRELVGLFLETGGYKVIETGDPTEAIQLARQNDGPLHLLITDVDMPGISGPLLAEKLAAIKPEASVLYISGYADGHLTKRLTHGQSSAFLAKPFKREDLLRAVRELLDSQIVQTA